MKEKLAVYADLLNVVHRIRILSMVNLPVFDDVREESKDTIDSIRVSLKKWRLLGRLILSRYHDREWKEDARRLKEYLDDIAK